jgi:aminoglycoside phosphotransferase
MIRPYPARMLRRVPRPTFGPLAGRRSRARARQAAPAALAKLGGPQAAGWRLGEPFEGRGDTNVFAVEAGDCSPALLKATGSQQGRLQLERQVEALTALHQDPRLGPWAQLVPRTLGVGDVDGLYFVLESRLPGADSRRLPEPERERVIPMALETLAELYARTRTVAAMDTATVDRWVREPAAQVRAVVRGTHRDAVDALAARLVAELSGRTLARAWAHGDYNQTNVLVDRGRVSGVVDWTEAEPDGLVGADVVTLLVFQRILAGTELGPVLLEWLADPSPVAGVVAAMQRAGAGEELDVRTILLLSWLRHVGGNLSHSTRYAANPIWMHRNVRTVLAGI